MSQDDRTPIGEVWWIYSPRLEPWAGLRIAHFGRADDADLFYILGETDPIRHGVRIWAEAARHEKWRKVEMIPIPKIEP